MRTNNFYFNPGYFSYSARDRNHPGEKNVLDIVLTSQKELVDNVKIIELLGNNDHIQIHLTSM